MLAALPEESWRRWGRLSALALAVCSGEASAAVDSARLSALVDELRPQMAAITHTELAVTGRLANRADLVAEYRASRNELTDADAEAIFPPGLVAHYQRGEVVVIADSLSATLTRAAVAREEVDDLVRCVVAHELVHAAQDARGVLPTVHTDSVDAVLEGQANDLALAACTEHAALMIGPVLGIDALGSRLPVGMVGRYGYGAVFVSQYMRRYGRDAVWELLAGLASPNPPLLTMEDIATVASLALPAGWVGWRGPAVAASMVLPAAPLDDDRPASEYELRGKDRTRAGLTVHGAEGADEVRVYAFGMLSEDLATSWVDLRRASVLGGSGFRYHILLAVGPGEYGAPIELPVRVGDTGAKVGFRMSGFGWTYREMWASRGSLLVGMAVRSRRRVDLGPAMTALLAGPPDVDLPADAAAAILDRLAP